MAFFRPEFYNRIDAVVAFRALDRFMVDAMAAVGQDFDPVAFRRLGSDEAAARLDAERREGRLDLPRDCRRLAADHLAGAVLQPCVRLAYKMYSMSPPMQPGKKSEQLVLPPAPDALRISKEKGKHGPGLSVCRSGRAGMPIVMKSTAPP